jgi:hypothetical protein
VCIPMRTRSPPSPSAACASSAAAITSGADANATKNESPWPVHLDASVCAERIAQDMSALEDGQALQATKIICYSLDSAARVAAARGCGIEATRLIGASERLYWELGAGREGTSRLRLRGAVAALASLLGPDAFARELEDGTRLALDDAVTLALEVTTAS